MGMVAQRIGGAETQRLLRMFRLDRQIRSTMASVTALKPKASAEFGFISSARGRE